MSLEGQLLDRKSLRAVSGQRADLAALLGQGALHKTGERRGTRYTLAGTAGVLTDGPANPGGKVGKNRQ